MTDMIKLTVTLCNFANTHKKCTWRRDVVYFSTDHLNKTLKYLKQILSPAAL